jgi:hypothetical protein
LVFFSFHLPILPFLQPLVPQYFSWKDRWGASFQKAHPRAPRATESGVVSVLSVLSGGERTGPQGLAALDVFDAAGADAEIPSDPDGLEALDAFEERAAVREFDCGEARPEVETAAVGEAAQAAGMTPEALQRLWAEHPDARACLDLLSQHGPHTDGAAGGALCWPYPDASVNGGLKTGYAAALKPQRALAPSHLESSPPMPVATVATRRKSHPTIPFARG